MSQIGREISEATQSLRNCGTRMRLWQNMKNDSARAYARKRNETEMALVHEVDAKSQDKREDPAQNHDDMPKFSNGEYAAKPTSRFL